MSTRKPSLDPTTQIQFLASHTDPSRGTVLHPEWRGDCLRRRWRRDIRRPAPPWYGARPLPFSTRKARLARLLARAPAYRDHRAHRPRRCCCVPARLPDGPGRHRAKAAGRTLPVRAVSGLDQPLLGGGDRCLIICIELMSGVAGRIHNDLGVHRSLLGPRLPRLQQHNADGGAMFTSWTPIFAGAMSQPRRRHPRA